MEGGGTRTGIGKYPYLIYLVCVQRIGSGGWVRLMNWFVIIINSNKNLVKHGLLGHFSKNSLLGFIGCIILVVTYGKKGYGFGDKSHRSEKGNNTYLTNNAVCGKIYLHKIIFPLYSFSYCYISH